VIEVVDIDLNQGQITQKDIFKIEFPAAKVMWTPKSGNYGEDGQLIGVASDKLKLFTYSEERGIQFKAELHNTMLKDLGGPLTSFDWSPVNNFICCSSIDTTCSIYDVNHERFYKQLIAHDKEVGLIRPSTFRFRTTETSS
jgi:WD40 repeat protein